MKSFKNKVVWLTGASSGIGEALAYAFSNAGAKLIISARRQEELERVKQACANPHAVKVLPLDLAKHHVLPSKVDMVVQQFGHVDLMLHNGGISQRALAKDTDIEIDKKIMDVNYFGAVILTKALLPQLLKQHQSHIAVVTSLTGIIQTPLRSAYVASKHALHGFFDSLRAEHVKDKLTVTLLVPGFVATNVSLNALKGDGSKQNTMDETTAKGLKPEECARRMLKAIKKEKEEALIGNSEIMVVYLKRFFPGIFSKLIARVKVT